MSPTSPYTGPLDPAYNLNYGVYKESEKRLVQWLIVDNNHSREVTLNYRVTLAKKSYERGSQMPDNIRDELDRAIEGRTAAIKHHQTIKGNHDERHKCPLNVLLEIRAIFEGPSSPLPSPFSSSPRSSRSSSSSSSTSPLIPSPKWARESLPSDKERNMNGNWRRSSQ